MCDIVVEWGRRRAEGGFGMEREYYGVLGKARTYRYTVHLQNGDEVALETRRHCLECRKVGDETFVELWGEGVRYTFPLFAVNYIEMDEVKKADGGEEE